ncbi:hypothetical protein WDU94_002888 [Cyamophila willieti]
MYIALIDEHWLTSNKTRKILEEVIKEYWTNGKVNTNTKYYIWNKFRVRIGEIKVSKASPKKEIQADTLLKFIRNKLLEYNNRHCTNIELGEQIESIITKAIQYEETKNKLRSLYGKDIIKRLRKEDIKKVKAALIGKYLEIKDEHVETGSFKTKCSKNTDRKLIANFEKDLLNEILNDENEVKIDSKIKEKITKILSHKEFDKIHKVSYDLIKTIIQELGYTVNGEEQFEAHQDCIKETVQLQQQLRKNDNIKHFNTFLERKLYDIEFATNLVHNKNEKAIHLYKIFESEYAANSNCVKDLRSTLVEKIRLYQKILRYSSILKEWKQEERCGCVSDRNIFFNTNPIENNTVIYRQNEFDMGYEISLSEPNKLIDASIKTYINVDNRDNKLVKETINNQPYINKGDFLPGVLKNYTTILKLEFVSKKKHDITLHLGLVDKAVHETLKIDIKLEGGIRLKGLIRPNGPRQVETPDDMKVQWKLLKMKVDKLELRPDFFFFFFFFLI